MSLGITKRPTDHTKENGKINSDFLRFIFVHYSNSELRVVSFDLDHIWDESILFSQSFIDRGTWVKLGSSKMKSPPTKQMWQNRNVPHVQLLFSF